MIVVKHLFFLKFVLFRHTYVVNMLCVYDMHETVVLVILQSYNQK
jgi:hypothetical protein